MREIREIRSVSANYFAAARVAAWSTRVSFYHAIWLGKEKTNVITSQKSFSGSGSQSLFVWKDFQQIPEAHCMRKEVSISPSDSQNYVCVHRLERPSPTPCWNRNCAARLLTQMRASYQPCSFNYEEELTSNVRIIVLWPTWWLNFMNIWLIQALNMTSRWAFVCWKVTWKWVNLMLML